MVHTHGISQVHIDLSNPKLDLGNKRSEAPPRAITTLRDRDINDRHSL